MPYLIPDPGQLWLAFALAMPRVSPCKCAVLFTSFAQHPLVLISMSMQQSHAGLTNTVLLWEGLEDVGA